MRECSNCGREYPKGKGYPKNELETCCRYSCWLELMEDFFIVDRH